MSEPAISPFAPPEAPRSRDSERDASEYVLAGTGRRFLNLSIDSLAHQLLTAVFALVVAAVTPPANGPPTVAELAIVLLSYPIYYILLEHYTGTTIGKLLTGTRVVHVNGGKPSFLQIVGRTFARLVPFEALSALGSPPVPWHDEWANCRVILKR